MGDAGGINRNRKLNLCPSTKDWPIPDLVKECPMCGDFLFHCCSCHGKETRLSHLPPGYPCHHYRIVFTDGACANNGQSGARAGAGIAYGDSAYAQMAVPITDLEDSFHLRSSQRAELYAAMRGLQFIAEAKFINNKEPDGRSKGEPKAWIIATDSEYVAKGMTEWLPKWRSNRWKTSKGAAPANLDLFLRLDAQIKKYEAFNIMVGFWRIPREHNVLADRLAKFAAVLGDVVTPMSEKQALTSVERN